MILVPECGYYNEEIDSEYAPGSGECEACYRYEICLNAIEKEKEEKKGEVVMEYERGINVNVRDLRECLEGLPDDMDVIIPVCTEDDENIIHHFRHVRTIGLLTSPYEEKPAFCIATAADGADMDTLMKLNKGRGATCTKVLF